MSVWIEQATMTAAVLAAPGQARLETVPVPEAAGNDVPVRLEGCGVCASSLPTWEGRPWFAYPLPAGAPGHEGWGRLEDGTRVAVLTERGYAEWAAVSPDEVVALPPELDDMPFPGEALACAVLILRRSGVEAGQRVAIVGMGFLGTTLAQLVESAGAEVVAIRRDTPLDALRGSCECVIEAGGVQETLDVASQLAAVGGRLVLAGYHQDGTRQVDLGSWNWRGLDVVNAHERDRALLLDALREAVRRSSAGDLDVERLVTHRFPLPRLAEAFEAARTRPHGFLKAVVEA
jgi:threonine dehydrogenase-like Zn-dependent dehydrogenase